MQPTKILLALLVDLAVGFVGLSAFEYDRSNALETTTTTFMSAAAHPRSRRTPSSGRIASPSFLDSRDSVIASMIAAYSMVELADLGDSTA